MTFKEWWDLFKEQMVNPEATAQRWQNMGREWARYGFADRSRYCHDFAAFHRQPFWKKFLRINEPDQP